MTMVDMTERTNRIWGALTARSGAFDGKRAFLGSVPPKLLQHATKKFLTLEPGERVLAFLDESVNGSGKSGIVLTDLALHTHEFGGGTKVQPLDQIHTIEVESDTTVTITGRMTRFVKTAKLMVNGELLVTSVIEENAPAVAAVRQAIVEGLGLTEPVAAPATVAAPAPPAADWYADPAGRHQWRYWDAASWTARVADDGIESTDPIAGAGA